jgi:acyl-[acyl-carrier-protein]-phospholipid O-acyltransferase/long-chain-fatty-acid--[acyl-carrier-protein] ligase
MFSDNREEFIMKMLLRAVLRLLFRTKVTGEKFQADGPTVILPNHVSFLDAIFLYAYLPYDACFVVNTDIAKKIKFVLRFVSHITVDPRNPYSTKKIVSVIKSGRPVVLFPEGRISTTSKLMKIYSGVGFIALKTGAILQPVILDGLELSKASRIKDKVNSSYFPKVQIYAGKPVQIESRQAGSFRLQKQLISGQILELLQETMFAAHQARDTKDNLFDKLIAVSCRQGAGKIMAEDIGGRVSYRKAIIGSLVLSQKLDQLLADEENIGVLLPNSIGHLVTLFALCYLGKTPAILNFSAGAENNLNCGETAGIKTILTSRQFIEKGRFEELEASLAKKFNMVYLEDIKEKIELIDKIAAFFKYRLGCKAKATGNVILFTSGSESKPKGVVLSHKNIIANLNQIDCIIDYTPQDKMFNALPMFHSFGLTAGTLLPVLNGIEVFLYPSPLHYKVIPEVIYDRNITILLGTPTFLHGYGRYAHPYDFYRLRYVLAGGEKLKTEVQELWQKKFAIRIYEGYGTTEASPVLALNTPLFYQAGTVGKFLPGIQYRTEAVEGIEAGGNLFVKGPNIMTGYLLHNQGFVPAPEWYNSGDVVELDSERFIRIKARLKRFAKISGEMISLDAVEKTAEQCFSTDRNAAVNITDSKKGEKIILYTMYPAGNKQMLREFLKATGQSMLALPAEIVVVDKLPLLGSGKTDYVTLKAWSLKENKDA